ncbi:hypothetical protein C3B55_00223 [Candidatus Pseudomonas adelgestsugas]|uniref:Uncharacterized protein n=1 Tax=Candidatus Pseudomonas adelgestsugas TaxID=1302376 RepID=A0ABX5R836_9PSED|nr:hypothetical protein C3B55_00223 [Candidatus Pseudomonas adelgestsugas]
MVANIFIHLTMLVLIAYAIIIGVIIDVLSMCTKHHDRLAMSIQLFEMLIIDSASIG